ncbi:hypothetical protein FBQ73_06905 [Xanthobacter autotrophicus]|uniref:Uncharacterized protein n=1 Tax=Xanthobacter autotrophicus TaxID=280 RepID=A0A6C1KWF8_XANAU|nr:hypothetical protein FBQ73_06905 [Xanthobacter autotrophicus]
MRSLLIVMMIVVAASPSLARNTPCSGNKGGVSHCSGDKFVCKDGSTSASKQKCSASSSE